MVSDDRHQWKTVEYTAPTLLAARYEKMRVAPPDPGVSGGSGVLGSNTDQVFFRGFTGINFSW